MLQENTANCLADSGFNANRIENVLSVLKNMATDIDGDAVTAIFNCCADVRCMFKSATCVCILFP